MMEKIFKSSLSLLLAVAIIISSAVVGLGVLDFSVAFAADASSAPESGTCGENLSWTIDNGTLTISGTGDMTNYSTDSYAPWSEITSVVIEYGVTSIGDFAFYNCKTLTSVVIPDSVITIGESAFKYCSNLLGVTIPDSVTSIGYRAFDSCVKLKNVTFSNSLTRIEAESFIYCRSIESITIPDNVESIGWLAFASCRSLKAIDFGEGVTSLEAGAFEECTSLECVVIPDNVTDIGAHAFYGCTNVASVVIPEGVISIETEAFSGCAKITSISIPDSVTNISGSSFAGTAYYADVNNWENGALYIDGVLMTTKASKISGHYDVKDGTRLVAEAAFACCYDLASVTIPDSVTKIGELAFYECLDLESVTLSNSLKCIAGWTFYECSSLKSITIPDGVTTIERDAFESCWNLETITIPDSVTHIDPTGFYCTAYYRNENNWENGVLYINNHLIKADESISGHCDIKYGTKTIAGDAFHGCTKLTSVKIPDTVTNICTDCFGSGAFQGCKGLKNVVIPNSVTSVEGHAFAYCTNLKNIVIPDSVTSIEGWTFYNCTGLESVTIPDSVTNIGANAFNGCKELTTLTIPGSVVSVGKYAFVNCTSLVSVTISEGVTNIGEGAFYGCPILSSITIPDSVTNIDNYAFGYKNCNGKTTKIDGFVVCGKPGTTAETYADENDFLFVDAEHTHIAPDWEIVKESTVNSPGIKLKECVICRAAVEIEMITQLTPAAPEVEVEAYCDAAYVTWNEVEGADEYILYRREYNPKTKKWGGWSRIADGLIRTYYYDDGVKSGTYYIYTVKARNEGGYGSYTSGAKIYYLSTPELTSLVHNNSSITFKWSKVEGATGYVVYRRDLSSWDGWKKVATTKDTTYVDKRAEVGVHYKYTVRAYYGSYRSHFDEGGLETVILLTPTLKSVSCSKDGATVKWGKVSGAGSYIVYRRTYDAKTKKWSGWTRIADRITGTSYVDKTAKSGKYYIYTIKASSLVRGGYCTSGYDKTGLKIYFLSTPALKSATSTKSGVKLEWNKVSGATGYKIYRKTGDNPWGEAIATVKGNSVVTYVDKTAKKGVTYTYTVRAYKGSTKSGYIPEGKTVKDKY